MPRALSLEQKRSFYRDGFVVLPGVVPPEMVAAARRRIFVGLGGGEPARGNEAVFMDLYNRTDIAAIIAEALGLIVRHRGVQLASRFPSDPSERINESGYTDRDTPFFGWHGHLDGLWNGAAPMHQDVNRPMTAEEHDAWHREPSRNGCLKFHPESNVNIMNFAALVGVALSDHTGAPNASGLRHYPDAVRDAFRPHGVETADGRFWPKPTLVRLAAGDAVVVLHAVPHCATRVEGSEPRLMAYFRIMPERRPSANRSVYPEALCDIWHEWPGMAAVVAEQRGAVQ